MVGTSGRPVTPSARARASTSWGKAKLFSKTRVAPTRAATISW
ncbi:MAG: hypothetical protein RIB97_19235 [Nitratireductor sp.]